MNNIYGLEALSLSLLSGFSSVSLGAGLTVGLAFMAWNYLNSAPIRLAGPLAAMLGLACGRFIFLGNLLWGNLWLSLLNSYLILGGGLVFIWLSFRRNRAIRSKDFWLPGPAPINLFWPSGLALGLALASLGRPGLDFHSLSLAIFGFKGQGWPLWSFWVLGNLAALNSALILFLGGYFLVKKVARESIRYRVEQVQSVILALTGVGLVFKSLSLF